MTNAAGHLKIALAQIAPVWLDRERTLIFPRKGRHREKTR
jgi:hypothetical protein